MGNERQLTNIAVGTQGTDAVNLDQLNHSMSNVTNDANAYTDQRYSALKEDLKKQDSTLSAGIAGAMAMASLTQPYTPGASMATIGAASYRGQSALSVGCRVFLTVGDGSANCRPPLIHKAIWGLVSASVINGKERPTLNIV